MARLRLLLALLAITAGSVLGALALSGYYEPHPLPAQPASSETVPAEEKASLMARPSRQRFVAATSSEARPAPAKPKPHQKKAAPAKPRPPPVAEKRPRRAEAPWPWSLFSN
jgi:hypothetical protein